jgi:hypothetical protein
LFDRPKPTVGCSANGIRIRIIIRSYTRQRTKIKLCPLEGMYRTGTNPVIPNHSTNKDEWSASHLGQLASRERVPKNPLNRKVDRSHHSSGHFGEGKIYCS